MVLPQHDAELIDLWATHGMPENQSTRDKAVRLLVALRAENRELGAVLDALTEDTTP